MVELVQRMLSLHEKLGTAKISYEKTFIQHQIDATDYQIDKLVYKLMGLPRTRSRSLKDEGRETQNYFRVSR